MGYKNISFGNDNAQQINDIKTKKKIIDFLFNTINLSKYRYTFLNSHSNLKFLKENEHYVSPNFHGYNYLLIFMTINDSHLSIMIDRRKLKYNKEHIDFNKLVCIKVNMNISKKVYNGTILDGKYIRHNNKNSNNYTFLVQDYYFLLGNSVLDVELSQKINMLDSTIKKYFSNVPCKNFNIKINKLYSYHELDTMITKVMPNLKLLTNGIIFFPKHSGTSIIFLNKKETKEETKIEIIEGNKENSSSLVPDRLDDIIMNMKTYLHNRNYSYINSSPDSQVNLQLKRTKIPDVYDIYCKNNDELVKKGIAHIPNMKTSHMCQDYFKNNETKLFKCTYYKKFLKWIPIEEAKNNKIDSEYKMNQIIKSN